MSAQDGDDRQRTCNGQKADGSPCKSYVKSGEDYCHHHKAHAQQADTQVANVVDIRARLKDPDLGLSSREERMAWLDLVWRGEVGDVKVSPRGDVLEIPASMKDRQDALKQLERMQSGESDEDESVLDAIAERVRARLGW